MSWDIFPKAKIQYFLQKLKDKFVQKETGKGLSTNDYTTTDKNKVSKIDTTTTSISGNPISISGLKANQLAKNPIITLEPIQAGSGTPSPSNIRAISGYDKIEVSSCGVNVWDEEWEQGGINVGTGANESDNRIRSKNPIPVLPNTAYYCKDVAWVLEYDASGNYLNIYTSGNTIFTTSGNTHYLKFKSGSNITTYSNNICVNVSNPDINGQYFPHNKATSISESLGQTVYGGTLDVRTGALTVDRQIAVYDGTSTIVYGGATTTYRYFTIGDAVSATVAWSQKVVSNMYPKSGGGVFPSVQFDGNKKVRLLYPVDSEITEADLTAILTATPLQVVYELATPFTIQLTPHEISLLKDYAYVSTNGTNIALDYHNGELASLGDVAQVAQTMENKDVLSEIIPKVGGLNIAQPSVCKIIKCEKLVIIKISGTFDASPVGWGDPIFTGLPKTSALYGATGISSICMTNNGDRFVLQVTPNGELTKGSSSATISAWYTGIITYFTD